MNIQYLKYAVEVEKTGSISQAAQNLFMGQPNLSRAIRELEASLGITLFRRTTKGAVATEKGREFFIYAKRILEQINSIESMYHPQNDNKQVFRLSTPRSSYISGIFTTFMQKLDAQQELETTIRETNTLRTIRNVAEDNYNLGIIRYQCEHEPYFNDYLKKRGLRHKDVLEFSYGVLLSSSHPLAMEQHLTPELLSPYIEIMHADLAVPFVPEMEEHPTHPKRRVYVFERGSQFDLLTHVLGTYMWVSPMPKDLLRRHHLTLRPCKDAVCHKDVLVYRDGYQLSQLDQLFLDELWAYTHALGAQGHASAP